MLSFIYPFGTPAGLVGFGDIGIAIYTFTATGIGQTTLTMDPDSPVSGGILANAGFAVDSISLSSSITVEDAVSVPEPGTLILLMIGLPLLLLGSRRRRA